MLKNIAPKSQAATVRRARKLRRAMTLPEVLLWQALRTRPAGLKFRRQHPSGPYILDFFCSDARLAVEVDGDVHGLQQEHDTQRDAWFLASGIVTLRIPAVDVLKEMDGVLTLITSTARTRLPLHHPAGGPPPPMGEE